jgi:hypothetical protein
VDVTTQVVQAINGWLAALERAVLGPALQAAGQLLFQTPALDSVLSIQTGWQTTRDIADALFVLALLAGGMLVMASGTFETEYTAKRLLPRIGLAAVLANTSLALCGALIRLDNALVQALLGRDAASILWAQLTAGAGRGDTGGEVLASLVGLATALLAVLLVVVYIVRSLVLVVGTVLAPLALACYAIPQTEEVAQLWWRVYAAGLFIQVLQSALIAIGSQLIAHSDWLGASSVLVSGLVLVTLLYLLLKLPFLAYRWAFRQQVPSNRIVQVVATAAKALA